MKIGFDFDGTLLDSRARHVKVLRYIWPDIDKVLGDNWEARHWAQKLAGKSTRCFLESEGVISSAEIALQWVDSIEDEEMLRFDIPYPFALQLLESISSVHSLCLITARKYSDGAQSQIRHLGYEPFFDYAKVVAPGADAGKRKAALVSEGGLDLVVGDTESDAEWADLCGARFLPVAWGFRSMEFWKNAGYSALPEPERLAVEIN